MPEDCTGLIAAKLFKYFKLFSNSNIQHVIPLERVLAKMLYSSNKKVFDATVTICNKYKIDLQQYMKFYAVVLNRQQKDIPTSLLNAGTISLFAEHLQIQQQYKKIYKWFMKSAEYISDQCVKLGFSTTKEYIRHLIATDRLAVEYAAGNISCYYLCAIQNFKQIIPKLCLQARDEFSKILFRYDKYSSDVQNAFKLIKSTKVSPIKFTDDLIWKKINNKQQQ